MSFLLCLVPIIFVPISVLHPCSCTFLPKTHFDVRPHASCGICFPCIRGSELAAGISFLGFDSCDLVAKAESRDAFMASGCSDEMVSYSNPIVLLPLIMLTKIAYIASVCKIRLLSDLKHARSIFRPSIVTKSG